MLECTIKERTNILDDEGKEIRLSYGLIRGTTLLGDMSAETYGVGIYAESQNEMSVEIVEDITSDPEHISALITTLKEFGVTPVTLRDIINDYIEN